MTRVRHVLVSHIRLLVRLRQPCCSSRLPCVRSFGFVFVTQSIQSSIMLHVSMDLCIYVCVTYVRNVVIPIRACIVQVSVRAWISAGPHLPSLIV